MCDFCKDSGRDLPPCHKEIGNHRVAKTVKIPKNTLRPTGGYKGPTPWKKRADGYKDFLDKHCHGGRYKKVNDTAPASRRSAPGRSFF